MATPDIKVIKLKVRRGTDSQRSDIVLDQGELGYTTDTKRCFIGDGVTAGGIPVDNKHVRSISSYSNLPLINSQKGDIVLVGDPPVAYQLIENDYTNISNWTVFTHVPDGTYLEFSDANKRAGNLTITPGSIDLNVLNINSLSSETITLTGSGIEVRFNSEHFASTSGGLELAEAGIDGTGITFEHISQTAFENLGGIIGGDGTPIKVSVDDDTIVINPAGQLSVSRLPLTAVRSDQIKDGLVVDNLTGDITTVVQGVDGDSITLNSGVVSVDFSHEDNITPLGYFTPQTLTDASIIDWDASNGVNAVLTLTDTNHTLRNIINLQPGQHGILTVIQSGAGFYDMQLDTNYTVIQGTLSSLSALPAGALTKFEWDSHNGADIYLRITPEVSF